MPAALGEIGQEEDNISHLSGLTGVRYPPIRTSRVGFIDCTFYFAISRSIPTLMRDLEDWPQHFMLLLALVAGVLGVFELVLELQ